MSQKPSALGMQFFVMSHCYWQHEKTMWLLVGFNAAGRHVYTDCGHPRFTSRQEAMAARKKMIAHHKKLAKRKAVRRSRSLQRRENEPR